MKQSLILVDIQNDYFDDGKMALVNMDEAAAKARKLLQKFRAENTPIFHVQHIATPGASFFAPDTVGVKTHASVLPQGNEAHIIKHAPNSFHNTDLLEQLQAQAVEEVVICGAMSHMCIDATTRAAADFGLSCVVIQDACATRDLQFEGQTVPAAHVHAAFMSALAAAYAKVMPLEQYGRFTN